MTNNDGSAINITRIYYAIGCVIIGRVVDTKTAVTAAIKAHRERKWHAWISTDDTIMSGPLTKTVMDRSDVYEAASRAFGFKTKLAQDAVFLMAEVRPGLAPLPLMQRFWQNLFFRERPETDVAVVRYATAARLANLSAHPRYADAMSLAAPWITDVCGSTPPRLIEGLNDGSLALEMLKRSGARDVAGLAQAATRGQVDSTPFHELASLLRVRTDDALSRLRKAMTSVVATEDDVMSRAMASGTLADYPERVRQAWSDAQNFYASVNM